MKVALIVGCVFALAATTSAYIIQNDEPEEVSDSSISRILQNLKDNGLTDDYRNKLWRLLNVRGNKPTVFTFTLENDMCNCHEDICKCCANILHKSICLEVHLNLVHKTLDVKMQAGGHHLLGAALPLDRLEKICRPVSFIPLVSTEVCLNMNVQSVSDGSVSACPKLEGLIESNQVAEINLGCITLKHATFNMLEASSVENSQKTEFGEPAHQMY